MMLSLSFEEKRFIRVETIDLIGFCVSFERFLMLQNMIRISSWARVVPISLFWEYLCCDLSEYKAVFASCKWGFTSDQENPLQSFT